MRIVHTIVGLLSNFRRSGVVPSHHQPCLSVKVRKGTVSVTLHALANPGTYIPTYIGTAPSSQTVVSAYLHTIRWDCVKTEDRNHNRCTYTDYVFPRPRAPPPNEAQFELNLNDPESTPTLPTSR